MNKIKYVELPKQFRPKTSITYPPFKSGRYLEEYFYDIVTQNSFNLQSDYIYIPIFWTNLQNHPGFNKMKESLHLILKEKLNEYPEGTQFFTVVQHDDGPQLYLPKNTLIFGSCTGDIPLPLIYEDTNNTIENFPKFLYKKYLASFIGSITHSIRREIQFEFLRRKNMYIRANDNWTNNVSNLDASSFLKLTAESKFCLAPRGYGRSSFRFFEAILLGIPPVYFWDDIKWLPYKEFIKYSDFSVTMHASEIKDTYSFLESISDDAYSRMCNNLIEVRKWFTLDTMVKYVIYKLSDKTDSINTPFDVIILQNETK